MDGESLEEHDAMMMTPLSAMAEAFEELDKVLRSREDDRQLRLDTFCEACSLVSVLFGCLGFAFKFAEVDYVSKVRDLKEASSTSDTLQDILDLDVANDTVKIQGSLSRNLRRVRQGLDLIRVLFEQFLTTEDCYLKEAASRAYRQVCAPYHSWTVRTAVVAGMCALPTRNQLLLKLNETVSREEDEKVYRCIATSYRVH
ncbi:hypothetical protein I3843_15G076800 [Carya illinoinensis]|uniref:ACD11 homolog protein isoform X2 n=1 Tax=Carya illinoinensis TaxID=32201 RepID=UPI001C729219|nr:ACD11 homolog protein isoform X2 [Carya illinoinensis]KAG7944030.1 hypothetical protein I3843_15G076800 [Carya illinoinensis]